MAVERLLLRLRRFARPLSRLLLRERQLLRQRLMPNPPLPEVLLQLRECSKRQIERKSAAGLTLEKAGMLDSVRKIIYPR